MTEKHRGKPQNERTEQHPGTDVRDREMDESYRELFRQRHETELSIAYTSDLKREKAQ